MPSHDSTEFQTERRCLHCGELIHLAGREVRRYCDHRCLWAARNAESLASFWNRVGPPNHRGCREWQGARKGGQRGVYGIFKLRRKRVLAHRMAYELTYGAIPGGLFVCHRCDNPPCCTPTHLFLGTNEDNMADKIRKGRNLRGEAAPQAKLNAEAVLAIRASSEKKSVLAERYGLSLQGIWRVQTRKVWRHVP